MGHVLKLHQGSEADRAINVRPRGSGLSSAYMYAKKFQSRQNVSVSSSSLQLAVTSPHLPFRKWRQPQAASVYMHGARYISPAVSTTHALRFTLQGFLNLYLLIVWEMANFAVKSIDHVVLTVKDVQKTVQFYTQHLGMTHETFTSKGTERYLTSHACTIVLNNRRIGYPPHPRSCA